MKIDKLIKSTKSHFEKVFKTFWEGIPLRELLGLSDQEPTEFNLPAMSKGRGYDVAVQITLPTKGGMETKLFKKKFLDSLDIRYGLRRYLSENTGRFRGNAPGWLNITLSWHDKGVLCTLFIDTPIEGNVTYSGAGVLTLQEPVVRSLTLYGSRTAVQELVAWGDVTLPVILSNKEGAEDVVDLEFQVDEAENPVNTPAPHTPSQQSASAGSGDLPGFESADVDEEALA